MRSWVGALGLLVACNLGGSSSNEEGEVPEAPPSPSPPGPAMPEAPADLTAPSEAQRSESGLASLVLAPGEGTDHPTAASRVRLHYTGWRASDGKAFDTTVRWGPALFGVPSMIPGWAEGVQQMVVGEKRRLWIPAELGFQGRPGTPAGALVIDVELLDFEDPPAPPDPLTPPPDALRTERGLAIVKIEEGEGPPVEGDDTVRFDFTGWTTDGEQLRSSFYAPSRMRGPVEGLASTWREIALRLSKGDEAYAWVPAGLEPGSLGAQDLVFHFHLIDVEKPLPAPDDAKSPPDDAKRLSRGVVMRTLDNGAGARRPRPEDSVLIHYVLWSVDGRMLENTRADGPLRRYPMDRLPLGGLDQALQEMVAGQRSRVWLPEGPKKERQPPGDLVLDVELVRVVPATPKPPKP